MSRYNQLFPIIDKHKPQTIVEVGTWNGLRALAMVSAALKHSDKVHYTGFDLFEDADDGTDKEELNVKAHHTVAEVQSLLEGFAKENPGFSFQLIKGNTRDTLSKNVAGIQNKGQNIDLVFLDGGHSIETIRGDYEALKNAKIIVFDDYYVPENGHPDITKYGCNQIAEELSTLILPDGDPVSGGGHTRMAVSPSTAWPGNIAMVVKTRNCVSDDKIMEQVERNTPLIENWIAECQPHWKRAVVVSGGPSFKSHLKAIKKHVKRGDYVFCVKTSHDKLLEAGVVPYGCILLDPRDHVQEFIENPHPDVTYMVASMVHPTTIDRLFECNAHVLGYHAFVGAGEKALLKKHGEAGHLEHILIGGGSTSATRGVSVLHAMGFRRFELYGFESSYDDKPTEKQVHGKKKKEPIKVEVSGRQFWSDAELIAQAQDFEKMLDSGVEINLEVHGDGLLPHIWEQKRRVLPKLKEVLIA